MLYKVEQAKKKKRKSKRRRANEKKNKKAADEARVRNFLILSSLFLTDTSIWDILDTEDSLTWPLLFHYTWNLSKSTKR